MKGLNANFQNEYHTKNIDSQKTPYLAYNIFFKSPDFVIFKTHMTKNIFANYIPNKRYFVSSTGSLPLKLWSNKCILMWFINIDTLSLLILK